MHGAPRERRREKSVAKSLKKRSWSCFVSGVALDLYLRVHFNKGTEFFILNKRHISREHHKLSARVFILEGPVPLLRLPVQIQQIL